MQLRKRNYTLNRDTKARDSLVSQLWNKLNLDSPLRTLKPQSFVEVITEELSSCSEKLKKLTDIG